MITMGKHEYRSRLVVNNTGVYIEFEDDAESYEYAYQLNEAARGMRNHDVFYTFATEAVDGEGVA